MAVDPIRLSAPVEHDGGEDRVASEDPLEIRVHGEALAVTMRTPGHDEEPALGFLHGRGPDRRRGAGRAGARPGRQHRRCVEFALEPETAAARRSAKGNGESRLTTAPWRLRERAVWRRRDTGAMVSAEAPEIRYARVGTLHLAYWQVGSGSRCFVLVSPWLSQIEVVWEDEAFRGIVGRLAQHGRVVAFDRRGAGLSDPLERPATLEERAADLDAVLGAVGAKRASLLCLNEGATMGLVYAAAHPERVESLVLYGAYAGPLSGDQVWWPPGPEQSELLAQLVEQQWGQGLILAGLAPSRAESAEFRRFLARLERSAASPATASALVKLMSSTDVSAVLSEISVPTLVIHRAGDPHVDVRHAHVLAEHIPDARLVILPGSDHFFNADDVDGLVEHVLPFLIGESTQIEPRRLLTTVLFTDIVDSTATAARMGDDRWRDLLVKHLDESRLAVGRHGGELIKSTGDGLVASFDGPARGARCGLAICDAARAMGISVRAGVHTGECERLAGDLAGIAVHIAARVCAVAEPSQVLATSTVRDLAVGSTLAFAPQDERELRGVPGAWRLFTVEDAPV